MITTLIVLILFGLFLIVVETFVPGGVLGTLGVLCILLSVVLTLTADELAAWPDGLRATVSIGIVLLSGVAIYLWFRYFAVKLFHRTFSLEKAIVTEPHPHTALIGHEGVALSELRPLGRIELDSGERLDARAFTSIVSAGTRITVIDTEPGNLVIRPIAPPPNPAPL